MKTVIKGKKKTSISRNGDTICWSSIVDYECRKLPKNEEDIAATGSNWKHSNNDSFSSSNSDIACNHEAKIPQKSANSEPPTSSTPLKKVVSYKNAEIQCELDKNESIPDINTADIKEIYCELNSVFRKRTEDIESKVPQDMELQIKTHEEWCKVLIESTEAILEAIQYLKSEFKKFAAAPIAVSQTELKFENDRNNLIKLLQHCLRNGRWNFEELELETLPFKEILNPDSDYLSEVPSSSHRHHADRSKGRLKSPFTKPKT